MKTYEDGLNEAWEVARKIGSNNGYSCGELSDIFGSCSAGYVFDYFTASEAIDAMENYEKIKVGDEVKYLGSVGVVIEDYSEDQVILMWSNGTTAIGISKKDVTKTGRHCSEIEVLLKQMQKD